MNRRVLLLACLLCPASCMRAPEEPDPQDTQDTEDPADTMVVDSEATPQPTPARDTDPPNPSRLDVTWGDEVPCPDPTAREAAQFTTPIAGGDWALQPYDPEASTLFQAGGITVADLDGDGDLDVFLPGIDTQQLYLQQEDGTFIDASATHLPDVEANRAVSGIPADLDGDGDLDIWLARYNRVDLLWRNLGDGHFEDATEAAGLSEAASYRSTAASFDDFDNDGDLDVFVGTFGPFYSNPREPGDPSFFYENHGDGTFTARHELLPQTVHESYVFVGGWQDLDGDGDRELYTVADFGHVFPNRLLWNDGGTFRPDNNAVGLDIGVQGMGLSWGDLNDDGWLDLTIASWSDNAALVGSADGVWFEAHEILGLQPNPARRQIIGWSTILADLDNDRDLDMIEGFGHIYNQRTPARQPDEIFVQESPGLFIPRGAPWGFAHEGQTRGVLAVDINQDGWLDLVRRDLIGPATIQLAQCSDTNWTTVTLIDEASPNRHGVGSQIRVHSADSVLTRTIQAGGESVLSAGPSMAHVGLGAAESIDWLEVRWPDGDITTHTELPVRRHLVVRRNALP